MSDRLIIPKFTLVITTRCNLRCKLCCEYVPQNKPFPDMTLGEEREILNALFATVDHVGTLHLSGGGEPFLHTELAEMVKTAVEYADKFDRLMLFTNCTVKPSKDLTDAIAGCASNTVIQASCYGVNPEREEEVLSSLEATGAVLKVEKYYGEAQSFGGWVDFGCWERHDRSQESLEEVFHNCAVSRDMRGNWRTRDGKAHWCSRSQRGMELGLIPDDPNDYVDLLERNTDREAKRESFRKIAASRYISACDYCSGDQGTSDPKKRYKAAVQIQGGNDGE